MKKRMVEVDLWSQRDRMGQEVDISVAWRIMSRLGYPGRYGGRTQDGLHEYQIINPKTGALLSIGKGISVAVAMCEAALSARIRERSAAS